VRALTAAVLAVALAAVAGCRKTGEGQYEVDKPVIGTEKDTVTTPSVDVGTRKDTVTVPTVETKKKEVRVPTVDVEKPRQKDSNP